MSKDLTTLSDIEVLAAVGDNGPAVVGAELFQRAEKIRKRNPNGALGPAIVGTGEPEAEPEAVAAVKAPKKPTK